MLVALATMVTQSLTLKDVAAEADRLVSQLAAIEARAASGPELFRRHLRSLRMLVRVEEARAHGYFGTKGDVTPKTLDFFRAIGRGLAADAGKWETYLGGRRSLVLAYVSRHDHTVQHYALTLPKDWEPMKAYPLYLELHGAGDPHPLGWAAGQVGLPEGVKAADYQRPTMVPMVERKGYHVYPFGRGNSGYVGVGEVDVWEALEDAQASFQLDQDRYYLYGFSMGGGGTWRIAARTPDKWAAIAMLAPAAYSIRQDAAVGLGRNVRHLPMFEFIGDKDFLLQGARGIRDEIRRHGGEVEYIEEVGLDHNFTQESQRLAARFFDGKVRNRPTKFSFVADTPEHLGAWGVRLVRDLSMSGAPSFECSVEGNTVTLTSQGTPGLFLDLVAMKLKGEVRVIWNGVEAYKGEAKAITVGKVPEGRGW